MQPLDPRLKADCLPLGALHGSRLLLMDNALVAWFVLVPDTESTELYELPTPQQASLLVAVNAVSALLKDRLGAHKVNVATIGNVVPQLHVHVVGRREDDFCWPDVVWGAGRRRAYEAGELARLVATVGEVLGRAFTPAQDAARRTQ